MALLNLFGDKTRIVRRSQIESEDITTIYGHVKLDLTQTALEPGDYAMRLLTFCGSITLYIPEHIGIEIDDMTLYSEVAITTGSRDEQEQPEGMWLSDNVDRSATRVFLRIAGLLGDINIVRTPGQHVNATAQITDSGDAERRPPRYEGETRKLRRD